MSPRDDNGIHTAGEAAAYLQGLIDIEKRPEIRYERLGLGPVRALLERLGNPERGLRVIHIAGSKGKGSTALFAEALLRSAGRRVGTFTSPHLERWTERFRIDGSEVSGNRLTRAVAQLRPHVDALRARDPAEAPTFFDATTAAALLLFRDAEVDCAILEVGLGGRLDSTNAVRPSVTCVTSIELEHTDRLGTTLAAIAGEKAGILKPRIPAVMGKIPREAADVIAARASECEAPLDVLGEDFHADVVSRKNLEVQFRDGPIDVRTRLRVLGAHQAGNAALALACVRRSRIVDDAELSRVAARGLGMAELPGRVELLCEAPWIVVDGAHTEASARALAEALKALPRPQGARTHFVVSISAGKNVEAVLGALLPLAQSVTVTLSDPVRSLAPEALAAAVRCLAPDVALRVLPEPHLALAEAWRALGADDCLCVAGSVYLAGAARGAFADLIASKRLDSLPPAPDRSTALAGGSPRAGP